MALFDFLCLTGRAGTGDVALVDDGKGVRSEEDEDDVNRVEVEII
jgi:hypothetical protein